MKKLIKNIFLLTLIIFITLPLSIFIKNKYIDKKVIYVATDGSDFNDGSKNNPYKTLEAANNKIKYLIESKEFTKGTITVNIRKGTYYINKSLVLENINSNNDNIQITYKSFQNEEVILKGSSSLDINDFKKITDETVLNRFIDKIASSSILTYDLKNNNVNYGNISDNIIKSPELFFNDDPMTLAKWPNEEYLLTDTIITNPGEDSTAPFIFTFKDSNNRTSLWENTDDIWMFGYWYHNWQDDTIRVGSINDNIIRSEQNSSYGVRENQRFYFVNILEELDSPNEYYIDRENGILYFYPPNLDKECKLEISQLSEPFFIINNSNNITLEGLTMEYNLSDAIKINESNNILINNCIIRNLSEKAVVVNLGSNVGVTNSNIYNTGTGSIYMEGGDRAKLISANHYVKNTEISNFSRLERCYSPAIYMDGVGISASNNLIYNSAHTAILFYGNNHSIEYNEIHSVGLETDDVGAIYSGRDWTFRGNKINFNYLHDIGNELSDYGIGGIYLDDCMSSAQVYGNIFYKVDKALYIGGGRNHLISNNLILDCNNSIYFDDRGLIWDLGLLYYRLESMPYRDIIWKLAYPELYNTRYKDTFYLPENNTITDNILYKSNEPEIKSPVIFYGTVNSNEFMDSSITLDMLDSEIENNPTFSYFNAIPYEKIGLNK